MKERLSIEDRMSLNQKNTKTIFHNAEVIVDRHRKEAIAEFVGALGAYTRKHNGEACQEDKIFACIVFGVDPEVFYDSPDEARELRALVAYHRELGTYDGAEA